MPSYEVALILRKMARPETAAVLKRAALKIYDNNGILFNIENLGERKLPYAISNHGRKNREGSYFLMKFDSSPTSINELMEEYKRDVDIVRTGFVRTNKPDLKFECTLEEESKPPAYREDVRKMLEAGRKKERKFEMKTGLKYNPFRT